MSGFGLSYADILPAGGAGGGQDAGGSGGLVVDNSIYEQTICAGGPGDMLMGGASTQAPWDSECSGAQAAVGSQGGTAHVNGAGGGGGSGYYGGGGGGGKWTYVGAGGGGGSSWVHAQASVVTSAFGVGLDAGGATEPDYESPAGIGGAAGGGGGAPTLGSPGRIVVVFQ